MTTRMTNEQYKQFKKQAVHFGVPRTRTPDARYTVQLECCGQELPQYVARFCGEWIGWSETRQGAIDLCHEAYNERMGDK